MSLRQYSLTLAAVAVAACGPSNNQQFRGQLQPVAPPAPVVVNASYAHTWDSVVELVKRDWGIATPQLSPSSGFIQSDMVKLEHWSRAQRTGVATCDRLDPDVVWLSILVSGDSARSTVEFSPRYFRWNGDGWVGCPTTGKWEHALSDSVKARAERHALRTG